MEEFQSDVILIHGLFPNETEYFLIYIHLTTSFIYYLDDVGNGFQHPRV